MGKKSSKVKVEDSNVDTTNDASTDASQDASGSEEAVEQTSEGAEASNATSEDSTQATEQASKEEVAKDPVEELRLKLKEQEDKHLRLLAEFENFKRRSAQEVQTRLKFAGQALAMELLPGLDNLERAIQQAKELEGSDQLAEFVKGVEMVQQNFFDAFNKSSIQRIFPKGEPFDPTQHEAVAVAVTDEVQPDHVAQVFQAGYMLHERVIRPAMVQVAKKG